MEERIILAVDTSEAKQAEKLVKIAKEAGATAVKLGLELSSATSWQYCAKLAEAYDLNWVADAKLDDIPNTVQRAVANICDQEWPPFGITVHTNSGFDALKEAQKQAGLTKILGVTVLTSITEAESQRLYGQTIVEAVRQRADLLVDAGVAGVVTSAWGLPVIKDSPSRGGLYTMVPGIRPAGGDQQDQKQTATPAQAISAGADLLVIGRPIHATSEPALAFQAIVSEMEPFSA